MKLTNLNESGLSRITSKVQGHAIGMITAFRGEYTREQNMQRNKSLKAKLLHAGFHVTPVQGNFIENFGTENELPVKENSFFVVNPEQGDDGGKLENVLRKLGEEFEQDSIFSKRFNGAGRVIGTTSREGVEPAMGDGFDVPDYKPGSEAQYMTKVHNRPFTFESVGNTLTPPNHNMGRWPLSILAGKAWQDIVLTEAELSEQ